MVRLTITPLIGATILVRPRSVWVLARAARDWVTLALAAWTLAWADFQAAWAVSSAA